MASEMQDSIASQGQYFDNVSLITSALASLVSFLIIHYHLRVFSYWSSRGIRGPTPWPVFGTNIYYIFGHKLEVDVKWRNKYGKTYGLYDGYLPKLRTVDNKLIRHVWIENFSSATDRSWKLIHSPEQRRWLFWSSGAHWSNQRAIISPLFSSLKLKLMFPSLLACVQRFEEEIERRREKSTSSIELSKDVLMSHTLSVISRTFFGLNLDTYKDKSSDFYKRAFAFAEFDLGWFFIWVLIPNRIRKIFQWDLTRFYKYSYFEFLSQSIIDERRRKSNNKTQTKPRATDIIELLLEAELPEPKDKVKKENFSEKDDESHYNDHISREELEKYHAKQAEQASFRKLDDAEIRSQMTFFFLGGFETTAATLTACFFELAHQQEIQELVYQEIKEKEASLLNEPSDLASLKQLDAFLSETMRRHSPVIEHDRMVTAESGLVLPTSPSMVKLDPGVIVLIPAHVLHYEPEYWQEPSKFDLTRFYPENKHNIKSCTYTPFGLGPRNCVGARFALMVVKATLASILLKYKVTPSSKNNKYPPAYKRHLFFLQIESSHFVLTARD